MLIRLTKLRLGSNVTVSGDHHAPFGMKRGHLLIAELDWSYEGVLAWQNGQYQISNASVSRSGDQLTKVENGDLVFDTNVWRPNGVPFIANDVINKA